MAYGWKDEEIALTVELSDLIKMAKLPGKRDEWYVSEIEATAGDKLSMDDPESRALKITFARTCTHKIN